MRRQNATWDGRTIRHPERLIGRAIRGFYPAHNFDGIRSPLEQRWVRIDAVRDIEKEPLDPITSELNPLLRRGRYLLICYDLDKKEVRRFWLESFTGCRVVKMPPQPASSYQVVIVDRGQLDDVAAHQIELSETGAGEFMRTFNRVMRDTPLRAALVECGPPAAALAAGRSR